MADAAERRRSVVSPSLDDSGGGSKGNKDSLSDEAIDKVGESGVGVHLDEPPVLQQLRQVAKAEQRDGDTVSAALSFSSLMDLLPGGGARAVGCHDPQRRCITHEELRAFVASGYNLRKFGICKGDRVGSLVPTGPESATCFLASASWCCYAPLNPASQEAEIESELGNVGAKAVVVQAGEDNSAATAVAERMGIKVIEIRPSPDVAGLFSATCSSNNNSAAEMSSDPPNSPEDIALVLHTSGTTGKKKVVPYRLRALVTGASVMAAAYEFSPKDTNFNMMPLFHVGGLCRNVLAPAVTGGCTFCMPSFNADQFWDLVGVVGATWYYGSPTMHQLILEAARKRGEGTIKNHGIRMISNAAGPLPHTVAQQLVDTFDGATVLPSYGMTECMPISAPPSDYRLERPGTSGFAVGPKLATMGGDGTLLPALETGEIVVKGMPAFEGYENNPEATSESFHDGWFKTGDKGHLDEDGYLFITGRSKEVINRGGEIISPTEIENELLKHPAVRNTLAFVVPHRTLQEVVGVLIVTEEGHTPIGLTEVQRFVSSLLFPAKWPQVVVHIDDVPKGVTGKPLRVKLATRFGLEEIDDDTRKARRIFDADCPLPGAKVSDAIPMRPRMPNIEKVTQIIKACDDVTDVVVYNASILKGYEHHGTQLCALVAPSSIFVGDVYRALMAATKGTVDEDLLPELIMPMDCIPRGADGEPDMTAINGPGGGGPANRKARHSWRLSHGFDEFIAPATPMEKRVESQFRKVLQDDDGSGAIDKISVDADFFAIGGNSIKAGQLSGLLRKTFNVPVSGTALFRARTIRDVVALITSHPDFDETRVRSVSLELNRPGSSGDKGGKNKKKGGGGRGARAGSDKQRPAHARRALRLIVLAVQAIPFVLFHPVQRIATWSLFIYLWSTLQLEFTGTSRFLLLVLTLATVKCAKLIVMPLIGIAVKWAVIGRYREGAWPVWSAMYLRWWFVNQTLEHCGLGMFQASNALVVIYYRMLGANIGHGVKLSSEAKITEADLVTIGDGVLIDADAFVGAFTLDAESTFILAPVEVGARSVICHRAIVAPGTRVSDGGGLGPLSCSYESGGSKVAGDDLAKYCRVGFPKGALRHHLFIGLPVLGVIYLIAYLPVVLMIYFLVEHIENGKHDTSTWQGILDWFLIPERVLLYLFVRSMRKCVTPFIRLGLVIFFKWTIIGRFREGKATDDWWHFKRWLMHAMLPDGTFCGVQELIGAHYEGISRIFRLLGAKIGKRVYWPGSGVPVVEYDLFECGDDAVWGSRGVVMCSDRGSAKQVILRPGANASDRCFLMPGVVVGEGAVLGSATLGPPDFEFPPDSKWLGSSDGKPTLLEQGSAEPRDYASPFSRAVYFRQCKWGNTIRWWIHPFINLPFFASVAVWRSIRIVLAWLLTDAAFGGRSERREKSFGEYVLMLMAIYTAVSVMFYALSIALEILSKWLVLGDRRQPGHYAWDEDSYCQRWKLYLMLQHVRSTFPVLRFLHGTPYMSAYWRAMGARVGRDVCLYPRGGDPMMTEPEMVTLKDRVGIDDAILVAHLNTQGVFGLDWLRVEEDACLRRFSRLMAGGIAEPGSLALEHTLVLPGNVLDENSVWQGWPSQLVPVDSPKFAPTKTARESLPIRRAITAEALSSARWRSTSLSSNNPIPLHESANTTDIP